MNLSLASRYTSGRDDRQPYLDRGFSTAELTIPSLLVRGSEDCNTTNRMNLPTPYQSAGARGVNVMSSKMSMGLFPPGIPFARHLMDMVTERTIAPEEIAEWRKGLADIDDTIYQFFEALGIRPQIDECMKQMLVGGNVLLILEPDGARVIKMTNYMVERDPRGRVETITIKEAIRPISLPDVVREKIATEQGPEALQSNNPVPIYTGVTWNPETKKYDVWQECLDMVIEGSIGSYREDEMPFLALWLLPVHGANWGYGFMSSYLGDLISLEGLSEALVKASAAAAKVIFALAEESDVDEDHIANAPNLSVIRMNPEHLKAIQLDKRADLVTTREAINDLRGMMARATLENSSFQRHAERVTREEVLLMAEELEVVLVGGYAQLGQSMQRPIVNWVMAQNKKRFTLPPGDMVRVSIVTGMEALGRSAELQRLDQFIGGSMQILGAQVVAPRLDVSAYMTRRAAALGFNAEGLVIPEEQALQQQQQERAAQLLGRMGPQLLQQLSGAAEQPAPEETQ